MDSKHSKGSSEDNRTIQVVTQICISVEYKDDCSTGRATDVPDEPGSSTETLVRDAGKAV
jgi:hypothetical protein